MLGLIFGVMLGAEVPRLCRLSTQTAHDQEVEYRLGGLNFPSAAGA
jgi:hypothetical protein